LYDLSRPKLQPYCFGFSTAPFTFHVVIPALVAGFVKVFRSGFLKARSMFLRWSLPLMRPSTVLTGVSATRRY